jgi:hypothetical protein
VHVTGRLRARLNAAAPVEFVFNLLKKVQLIRPIPCDAGCTRLFSHQGPINSFYQHPLVLIAANSDFDPVVVYSESFDVDGSAYSTSIEVPFTLFTAQTLILFQYC